MQSRLIVPIGPSLHNITCSTSGVLEYPTIFIILFITCINENAVLNFRCVDPLAVRSQYLQASNFVLRKQRYANIQISNTAGVFKSSWITCLDLRAHLRVFCRPYFLRHIQPSVLVFLRRLTVNIRNLVEMSLLI
jgi:hypothetical protein